MFSSSLLFAKQKVLSEYFKKMGVVFLKRCARQLDWKPNVLKSAPTLTFSSSGYPSKRQQG